MRRIIPMIVGLVFVAALGLGGYFLLVEEEDTYEGSGLVDTSAPTVVNEDDSDRGVLFTLVPTDTVASYTIDEVFLEDGNTLVTAVGRTSQVQGAFWANFDNPTESEFEPFVVDISTLKSDRSRRDRAIRKEWLESSTYPLATFEVSEIRDFPDELVAGETFDFQLVGDMKVKETTIEVVWDVTAVFNGDTFSGTATLPISLPDFNVPAPSLAGVLTVEEDLVATFDFTFVRVDAVAEGS
ncbi:MAG TPA: YceI family protein [Anaerolineae bacterium]|nr:YceI family protein [Anaerolineae bacterium]